MNDNLIITEATTMKVDSIKDFVKAKGFVQIVPRIRINTNKYPFVTFIDGVNKAENIYFSKNASKLVAEGQVLTKDMLAGMAIGYTTNEDGEKRIKIISNSERVDINSLLD